MSLRSINLNLLPILQALLRERNISRAARALGLTQPAVSAALTRLRATLGDPILIRRGRSMELTVRGRELVEPVDAACAALEDFFDRDRFDPSKSDRRFVIAGADYGALLVGPIVIEQLRLQAPRASVHFVDTPDPDFGPHEAETDFLIVPSLMLAQGPHPAVRTHPLIRDEFVVAVAADHPLADAGEPSRADLLAQRYITYYPGLAPFDYNILTNVIGRIPQRQIVAQVQQFSVLPALAMETGCAVLVLRRIADYMARFMPIRILPLGPLPLEIDLSLVWSPSRESDPAHRWFRQLLIEHATMA